MYRGPSRSGSDPNRIATLCDLPTELLLEIIQHLDNPALVNLGLTCHCVHSLALETYFDKNKIRHPGSGWLFAYQAPIETLPALRGAVFVQKIDQLHFYFNPPVERMIEEVRDLRTLISRMQATRRVKLYFKVMDRHVGFEGGERQVLNPEVWQKELQGLFDLALRKGCDELYVEGGASLIGLYPEHGEEFTEVEGTKDDMQNTVESDLNVRRERQKRKRLLGMVQFGPFTEFVDRFIAPETQYPKIETPCRRPFPIPFRVIKPTEVSIHSEVLLRYPFLDGTIAMLNSESCTITKLSLRLSDIPQRSWKKFLNGVMIYYLSDFEITSDLEVSLQRASFTDVHTFLAHHPSIETLHLCGVDVPKGIWPPPSHTTPILPRLKSIIAHPFYVVWILNSLKLVQKASRKLTDIGISSECYQIPAPFDGALFDYALKSVAAFPAGAGKLKLTLRFTSLGDNFMKEWIDKHLAMKSSVISRLKNVTSLVISAFWHVHYEEQMFEVLPDWLGMFPKVTAIKFTDNPAGNVLKLEEKEFVRRVAMACRKVGLLEVPREIFDLDEVRERMKANVG